VSFAAVYKSPGHAWNDADLTELLSFRLTSLLAGDLKAKHPFWNSVISNLSGAKLSNLLHKNEFEIPEPQCATRYSPAGNGDLLDIVMQKKVRLSEVIVYDILDSDHLRFVFHFLDHVRSRSLSDPVDEVTGSDQSQSLASELISPRTLINSDEEADKAAHDFTVPIASAYRLSTIKITFSDFNKDLPGLEGLLIYKRRLRKLWEITRDSACKTAINWVTKTIRSMTPKRHSNGAKKN
jgi:hypothetical protein